MQAAETMSDRTNKRSLAQCTRGLSFTEYLILLVVVGVAGIVGWQIFGSEIKTKGHDDATREVHELGGEGGEGEGAEPE